MSFFIKIVLGVGIGILISQKHIKKIRENMRNN